MAVNATQESPLRPTSKASLKRKTNLLPLYFVYVLCGFAAISLFLNFSAQDQLPNHHKYNDNNNHTTAGHSQSHHHHHFKSFLQGSKESLGDIKTWTKSPMPQDHVRDQEESQPGDHDDANKVGVERQRLPSKQQKQKQQPPSKDSNRHVSSSIRTSPLAGLSCVDHDGPDDALAREMVYWKDIKVDNRHVSPFYAPHRYLTFEPDEGGFNNMRMSMETVVAMAYAMGRTLVLPPADVMYLLGDEQVSFATFFDMPSIHAEHNGLDIITTEEFLKRQVRSLKKRNHKTDKSKNKVFQKLLTPGNRTNWDGEVNTWFRLLRKNVKTLIWDPDQCFVYFPASSKDDTKSVKVRYHQIVQRTRAKAENLNFSPDEAYKLFLGKPPPVNASEDDRLEEFHADRKTLCLYNSKLQKEPILHLPGNDFNKTHRNDTNNNDDDDDRIVGDDRQDWESRWLVHFYAFLFFADHHQDLWMKRFIRDHFRYTDQIQCAAARVVAALRHEIQTRHGRPHGLFHSIHVRRGDFQYKEVWISAEKLLHQMQQHFHEGDVVFVATDHRNMTFFQPLREHYRLYFLDDFVNKSGENNSTTTNTMDVLGPEIKYHFYGMIDQLVASRGQIFIGCGLSTFTAYINRLRGYHSQKNKEAGYEDGKIMTSFYYAPPYFRKRMLTYQPIHKPLWAAEFPTAWRLIDQDVVEYFE